MVLYTVSAANLHKLFGFSKAVFSIVQPNKIREWG